MTVISLYTGAGGLDYGFEAAGFETGVAVENDRACCQFLRLNRPEWPVIERAIGDVPSAEILEQTGLQPGEPQVLIGGPPCQPFSKSGYWASGDSKRLDDPRADTLTQYLRVLRDTLPEAFLLENVQGFVFRGKDEGYRYFLEGVEEINRQAGTNYVVHTCVLNAASFGVPQLRERVFLIASRYGYSFKFPKPSHGPRDDAAVAEGLLEPYRTTWDALADIDPNNDDPALQVGGKWGELLPTIPEGQNYLWHTDRGGGVRLFGWRRRFWGFLLKVAKTQPTWTIQAQPGTATGPFHWRSRRFSPTELCRLQSFPEGLRFECSQREAQRLLGNAVPSLLAEVLASAMLEQFFGEQLGGAPHLLRPVQHPTPAPESPAELPARYYDLVAEHDDHPGEGLGPRGRLRNAAANG
ncbi:DNA cytosine methyltransferase [Wenzhouxiangella sediminis]|uniref:DNA (cytosine-5-)-methyltransferase n=1 Tax=Wenzhouxiangella sediminis TaxID=1792836 RepID=A0A3E1KBS3_9GAMM|nr:DNA cytosine methyltransferase [Wenzhouxiangella sediminis]